MCIALSDEYISCCSYAWLQRSYIYSDRVTNSDCRSKVKWKVCQILVSSEYTQLAGNIPGAMAGAQLAQASLYIGNNRGVKAWSIIQAQPLMLNEESTPQPRML